MFVNCLLFRAHETLVGFLKDQQCEEETILSALGNIIVLNTSMIWFLLNAQDETVKKT